MGTDLNLDELTGTKEAAALLGVTGHTVRAWCETGTVAAKLIGRTYVLRKSDVAELAREQGLR